MNSYAQDGLRAAESKGAATSWRTLLFVMALTAAPPILAQKPQPYPVKPIRLVGLSAGGQVDTLARLIGPKMTETWGQPIVIDNRPGAGGSLAAVTVARAAPDGYTLLLSTVSFATSAALYTDLPYDAIRDFAGVAQIGYTPSAVIVAPALGATSVKELIALARAQPGRLLYAHSGAGSGTHLAGERFRLAADVKVTGVGFKGQPQIMLEIATGRVHYCVCALASALQFVKEGKVLALAVNTPQRVSQLPDVPTLADTLPGFEKPEGSIGLLAPAKTPRPVLNQLSREVARILALPDVSERMQSLGFVAAPTMPEEYDRILRAQIATLSKVVRDAGLRK